MSLTVGAAGGNAMAQAMPMPNVNTGSAQAPHGAPGGCCSPFTGLADDGSTVDRGTLTGERCLTFVVQSTSSMGPKTAEWDEQEASVRVTNNDDSGDIDTNDNGGDTDTSVGILAVVKSRVAEAAEKAAFIPKKKKGGKGKRMASMHGYGNIAMVVPCSMGHGELYDIIEEVESTGVRIKHVCDTAVACVAGASHRMHNSKLSLQKMCAAGRTNKNKNNNNNQKDANSTVAADDIDTDLVLYLGFCSGLDNKLRAHVALVQCEGKTAATSSGTIGGYSRFAIKQMVATDSSDEDVWAIVRDSSACQKATCIVVSGITAQSKVMDDVKSLAKSLAGGSDSDAVGSGLLSLVVEDGEAVRGGCLLAAAELSSSKQYVKQEDGNWKLMFLLGFGDGYLQHRIGVKIEHKDGSVEESEVFGPVRIPKKETGPANSTLSVHPWERKFTYEGTYQSTDEACDNEGKPWPRVSLIENSGKVVRVVYPLLYAQGAVASEATLTILVDPALSAVRYRVDRGKSVGDIKASHRITFYMIVALLVLVGAYVFLNFGDQIWKASQRAGDEKWLADICDKHAPSSEGKDDDSINAEMVERNHLYLCKSVSRTIKTFSAGDKMWLLHRRLQRGFDADFSPPPSLAGEL